MVVASSLTPREHFPCCHGSCGRTELTKDSTPAWVDEVLREMPNASIVDHLAEVMRRSKGAANPKTALDLIHYAHKGGL
jgi:hypothetical protein